VAEADARMAQANLDRALKLVSAGFISNADIDKLTAVRDAADARVRVAQAQLGETAARIRRLNIVAPADGLVLDRMVEPGQVVSPGRARCSALPNRARWKCARACPKPIWRTWRWGRR
jgi:multidrug resistance efflux pump